MTTTLSNESVAAFLDRFSGYERAHGELVKLEPGELGDKRRGRHLTVATPVTLELMRAHLDGSGVGIGVIMLRHDNTCRFGAIDLDDRSVNHVELAKRVQQLRLPLAVCRSKSGGAHLYLFTSEPAPATLFRERLTAFAAQLGFSNRVEIFPKQVARYNEKDVGNWINLPYFEALKTLRPGYGADGSELTLDEFLTFADTRALTPEALERYTTLAESALFPEGPPCLQLLEQRGGFDEGERNLGMAAVAVYLRKRHPDDWQSKMDPYNLELAKLGSAELQHIIKTHSRKQYTYQCKQPPIAGVCQRRLCLTRRYGIAQDAAEEEVYELNGLTRYQYSQGDDVLWGAEVNGQRILVTTAQLYSRDEFNRATMSQAGVIAVHMNPSRWLKYLGQLLPSADVVEMPAEASQSGQLWEWIENFCLQTADALEREEVWMGKPYFHDGYVYFRSIDLFKYLDARRVAYKSTQHVWQLLRTKGADKEYWNIKGKGVNVWKMPAPERGEDATDERFTVATAEF